jgi:pilus assembly protein CpaC
VAIHSRDSKITLTELQTRILELSSKIRSVDGHDPDVLTIIPVSNHRIRLKAEKSGVTTFTLTDEFDNVYTVEVFVDADVRQLQSYLGRLFPGAAIEAVGLNGSVVLRGWVTEPAQIPQIIDVAKNFTPNVLNQLNVGGVSQIQLQVKVMEIQRSKLRQFGFNFDYVGENGSFSITPSLITDPTIEFAVTGASSTFDAFIEAVETNSLAKVLAETTLVTNSGRPATLLAGGQFPILVPQQLGTVTIEYREFGVRMEAVPIALGNGRLRLQVAPEVSERDVSSAVVVNGFPVPGITLRRVNTEVEMRFGETLMLGGLILQRQLETRSKIPYLGDLPWVGSAFSRRRSEVGETELLIMVTPQMAAPIAACQLPITGPGTNTEPPSDHEFYFDGHIEVPSYNPIMEPIGGGFDQGGFAPIETVPGLPGTAPALIPPAPGAGSAPPVPETEPEGAGGNTVTQTSGIRPSRSDRGTTIGFLNPFRVDRRRPVRPGATVRSNAGDDVRPHESRRSGDADGMRAQASPPTAKRLELVEQAPPSTRPRAPLAAEPPPRKW